MNTQPVFRGLLLFFGVVITVSASQLFSHPFSSPSRITINHVVAYTEEGFVPQTLEIAKGDSIRFVNRTGEAFWPASDPHPTHDIHGMFDSKRPIGPNEEWIFQFEKTGIFPYHNHLFATHTGRIVVGGESLFGRIEKKECTELHDTEKKAACWEAALQDAVQSRGIRGGFDVLRDIALSQPDACHGHAHTLGSLSYKEYLSGRTVSVQDAVSSCGYGFWHGFMSSFSAGSGLSQAGQFCRSLTGATPSLTERIIVSCFHGVGIGLIADPPPQPLWGRGEALLEPALRSCEEIAKGHSALPDCFTGVFHGVVNYLREGKYLFSFDKNNPFSLCHTQKEKYKESCYLQVSPKIPSLMDGDFLKTIAILRQIDNEEIYRRSLLPALSNLLGSDFKTEAYEAFFERCRTLETAVFDTCLSGGLLGIFERGIPGKEYVSAVEFCGSDALKESEQKTCFKYLIALAESVYDDTKMHEMCTVLRPELPCKPGEALR